MSETSADLDNVFVEIGEFGRYQIITFVLLSALNFLNGISIVNFMISASMLEYRWVFSVLELISKKKIIKMNESKIEEINWSSRIFFRIFRCKVLECDIDDDNRNIPYNRTWLNNAIPLVPLNNDKFESCLRFAPQNSSTIGTEKCSADMFDTATKIKCSEFIHASDERNLQTEVNHCSFDDDMFDFFQHSSK